MTSLSGVLCALIVVGSLLSVTSLSDVLCALMGVGSPETIAALFAYVSMWWAATFWK